MTTVNTMNFVLLLYACTSRTPRTPYTRIHCGTSGRADQQRTDVNCGWIVGVLRTEQNTGTPYSVMSGAKMPCASLGLSLEPSSGHHVWSRMEQVGVTASIHTEHPLNKSPAQPSSFGNVPKKREGSPCAAAVLHLIPMLGNPPPQVSPPS